MIIALNRRTGNIYSYSPLHTYSIDDFIFADLEDFKQCMLEDENEHTDDYLLFEVNKIFKPNVEYEEVDYESGDIY